MNIINLRKIGSFEIPDSYMGILRISPNEFNEEIIDDPTEILKNGNTVPLSDSVGNSLAIEFQCKKVEVISVNGAGVTINLPSQLYKGDLYVADSLNIRSSLYFGKGGLRFNEKYNIKNVSAVYDITAPIDTSYFWYNIKDEKDRTGLDKLSSTSLDTHENEVSKLAVTDSIFTNEENEKYWVNINGEYQYMAKGESKVPKIKKHDYVLGSKYDPDNKNITKIEFLNLQELIHDYIKKYLSGIHRDSKYRYFDLHDSNNPNKLATNLFGEDIAIEDLENTAPIIGIPVQSGTIHYNAIPSHRYFFHLARRESENNVFKDGEADSLKKAIINLSGPMNALCTQYILCDGKKIYENTDNGPVSDYSNINIKKLEKENPLSISDIKVTPPLFDINQRTLRFLRGLNWLRAEKTIVEKEINGEREIAETVNDYNIDLPLNSKGRQSEIDQSLIDDGNIISTTIETTFLSNPKTYLKIGDSSGETEKANHPKNINELGLYLSSTDKDIQYKLKHSHLLFENKNVLAPTNPGTNYNTSNSTSFINGSASSTIYDSNEWNSYITSESNATFKGSYILKTASGKNNIDEDTLSRLQNQPIAMGGGIPNFYYTAHDCGIHSYKKRKHGGLGSHKCYYFQCCSPNVVTIKDTAYFISRVNNSNHNKWRFISSLAQIETDKKILSTATFNILDEEKIAKKDIILIDGAHNPPSMNFIPLMKI